MHNSLVGLPQQKLTAPSQAQIILNAFPTTAAAFALVAATALRNRSLPYAALNTPLAPTT